MTTDQPRGKPMGVQPVHPASPERLILGLAVIVIFIGVPIYKFPILSMLNYGVFLNYALIGGWLFLIFWIVKRLCFNEIAQLLTMKNHGKKAKAVVTHLWVEEDSDRVYAAAFRFTPKGSSKEISAAGYIYSEEFYKKCAIGTVIDIRYSQKDPQMVEIWPTK